MLRKVKRRYRFSEQVESELKKLGIHLDGHLKNCQVYADNDFDIIVYSDKMRPFIQLHCGYYSDNLQEFSIQLERLKERAIKVYEIVMQDYPDY